MPGLTPECVCMCVCVYVCVCVCVGVYVCTYIHTVEALHTRYVQRYTHDMVQRNIHDTQYGAP